MSSADDIALFQIQRNMLTHKSLRNVTAPRQLRIDGKVYELKVQILHHGTSVESGHYTVFLPRDGAASDGTTINDAAITDSGAPPPSALCGAVYVAVPDQVTTLQQPSIQQTPRPSSASAPRSVISTPVVIKTPVPAPVSPPAETCRELFPPQHRTPSSLVGSVAAIVDGATERRRQETVKNRDSHRRDMVATSRSTQTLTCTPPTTTFCRITRSMAASPTVASE
jgi:hypothetical protein